MSFILDALRKSDAERQRAATPGLADVRYAVQRSRRNLWMPVLVLVLLANMLFMGLQWYRGGPAPAPAPTPESTGTPAPTPDLNPAPVPAPPAAAMVSPAPAGDIRPLAREADSAAATASPRPAPASPVPAPAAVASVDEAPAAPLPAKAPSRILESNQLPTAADLIAAGTLATPPLNLDLHVYSAAPAGRFVIINSRKYREGAQLSEGPQVEAITEEGVILSSQGRRFVLSRQ